MTKFDQIEAARARRAEGKSWPVGDPAAVDKARKEPPRARFLAASYAVVKVEGKTIRVIHDGLDYETASRAAQRLGLKVQRIRNRFAGRR